MIYHSFTRPRDDSLHVRDISIPALGSAVQTSLTCSHTLRGVSLGLCRYPLRAEEAFGTALARKKNRDAYLRHKELVEEGKCNYEACKGFVCAESFPRCFYINDKQQGQFRFETCRQTCEECYSSCKPDAALKMKYDVSQCSGNPSQYTIACTSDARYVHIRAYADTRSDACAHSHALTHSHTIMFLQVAV